MCQPSEKIATSQTQPTRDSRRSGSIHFVIALVVVCAIGVGIHLYKRPEAKPIEWPRGVRVNSDFRLISLPKKVGPFELIDVRELKEDVVRALGIGTGYDKERYPFRQSSWYGTAYYADRRKGQAEPFRLWRMEIFYYTGLRDNVPHVPERCLDAGGVSVLSRETVQFKSLAAPEPWDKDVEFRRVHYRVSGPGNIGSREGAEYYIFSVNGTPYSSSDRVRVELAMPNVTYSYFAKIQFAASSSGGVEGAEAADAAAGEFINVMLPSMLNTLPMADDIEDLKRNEQIKS